MSKSYQYLFGPVPSRRLGRSLGVDLIPFKTCSLDCVYCQLGETPCAVSERADYVPMADVLAELERWKAAGGEADHITLAGSGEPTLHLHFGEVFRWVREASKLQSVLLTNGSLLYLPEVRESAALADKVKVTLSAWDEESFLRIHRPAKEVSFEQLIVGERAFREIYSGELLVEVFIVEGVNSSVEQCRRMAEIVASIQPDRIDINTAVRPPADVSVKASSEAHLKMLADLFGEKASVTASFKSAPSVVAEVSDDLLLGLIKRHPASGEQLVKEFNVPLEKLTETLARLVAAGQLLMEERAGEIYYFCRS